MSQRCVISCIICVGVCVCMSCDVLMPLYFLCRLTYTGVYDGNWVMVKGAEGLIDERNYFR
jgi:hypothetical protein